MTSPLHAREIKGNGRYYGTCGNDTCPFGDQILISVTNAQGVVAKPALVPAAVKVTAETAWQYLPHMVRFSRQPESGEPVDGGKPCEKRSPVSTRCGGCRFCLNMAIKKEHQNQWDAKADFGTLVHSHAHGVHVGQPMPHDPDVEPFIGQHLRFLNDYQVDLDRHLEASETTILHAAAGYAGTGDLWLLLPVDPETGAISATKRWLYLVDIKTSLTKPATSVYSDQVLQLAGLRYAPKAILADDTEVDTPKFAGTALLNLRADDYRLVIVPTPRAAHDAFVHAVGLQTFMHQVDTKTWRQLSPIPAASTRKAS